MIDQRYILPSTNDNTDRTADIQAMLEQHGVCMLGSGIYVVSGVERPKSSAIKGGTLTMFTNSSFSNRPPPSM